MKQYAISPKQLEDWNYNFALKRDVLPNVMKIMVELEHVDPGLLSQSFTRLVGSHESLRTCFPVVGGTIVQQVDDGLSAPVLAYLDGQDMPDPETEINRVILDMKDITTGPLFRGFLVSLSGGKHLLCLLIHHIISDYWSTKIIRRDLLQIYTELAKGRSGFLLPRRMQLGEFTGSAPELQEGRHEMTIAYWKSVLVKADWQISYPLLHQELNKYIAAGLPEHTPRVLRFGTSNDLLASPAGEAYHWHIREELFERLKNWSKRQKVSLNIVILSALNLLAYVLSGKDQVLIQSHFAGRIHEGAEHVVGNLIGKLLLMTTLSESASLTGFLKQVNEGLYQAMERIVFNSAPLNDFPLTTGNFIFLNYIPAELSGNGIAVPTENSFTACASVESPLVCYAVEHQNLLRIQWSYNHLYFDRASVRALVSVFENILSRMVAGAGDSSLGRFMASIRAELPENRNSTLLAVGEKTMPFDSI